MEPEKKTIEFAQGINFDRPREGAPEFIKGRVSVQVEKFYEWAKQHTNQNGFVNLDLKKSKEKGTLYLQLNDWKKPIPKPDFSAGEVDPDTMTSMGYNGEAPIDANDIPF